MEQVKKIILAEDDPFLIDLYMHKFPSEKLIVRSAVNGRKALEMIAEDKPDLLLLDLFMPEINGWEVLEKIKSQEETKNIPVIILSNVNEKNDMEKARALGADDYLVKACFTPQEVLDVVNKLLQEKQLASSLYNK